MTPPFLKASLPVPHGFFTRIGGVSTGSFASLNCSLSRGDERDAVMENRALVAAAMEVSAAQLLGLRQVHGIEVVTVKQGWNIGAGMDADAMVTATPGFALGIITADCAPVLFSDGAGKVVGAAHAGWRGAVAGVLEATVDAMQKLGAADISAAIGPCIHQASYEVSDDLRSAVLASSAADVRFFIPGRAAGKYQFDLPGYCASRLADAGVKAEILPHDTLADEANFFSYRRRTMRGEPAIGHQISVIRL